MTPPTPNSLNHTGALVIARTCSEDVSWTTLSLRASSLLETLIYSVNDPHSTYPVTTSCCASWHYSVGRFYAPAPCVLPGVSTHTTCDADNTNLNAG